MLYENIVVYPIGLGNGKVSRTIYEETNTFIEKWSKVIHFAFVRVSLPFIAGPYFILSYFQYFINDLGSEAFYLPFLIWYFILVEFRINRSTYFCLGYIFFQGIHPTGETQLDIWSPSLHSYQLFTTSQHNALVLWCIQLDHAAL